MPTMSCLTPSVSLRLATSVALAALLGGCATPTRTDPWERAGLVTEPGVTIASSQLILQATPPSTLLTPPSDCADPVQIRVENATGGAVTALGPNGEPCNQATLLFDGRDKISQRSPDPGIRIDMQRVGTPSFTNMPIQSRRPSGNIPAGQPVPGLNPVPEIPVRQESLRNGNPAEAAPAATPAMVAQERQLAAIEPAAGPAEKTSYMATRIGSGAVPSSAAANATSPQAASGMVTAALNNWQQRPPLVLPTTGPRDDLTPLGTATIGFTADEGSAAAGRAIANTTERARLAALEQQSQTLLAALREKERLLQKEQELRDQARAHALKVEKINQTEQQKWQETEAKRQSQLQETQKQLATYEQLNQRLQTEKKKREELYAAQMQTLKKDLTAAESQAAASRAQLVQEAAKKIAEAEALANAARMTQADANAREAVRMKQQAEVMMAKAIDLQNNQAIALARRAEPTEKAPMALLDVPVVVHVKDQTLEAILADILKQAAPQAGAWRADWQLPAAQALVLQDKWSLTAEAPVASLLQNLTDQVQASRGMALVFTQFPQSRLVVVTAAPQASAAK